MMDLPTRYLFEHMNPYFLGKQRDIKKLKKRIKNVKKLNKVKLKQQFCRIYDRFKDYIIIQGYVVEK